MAPAFDFPTRLFDGASTNQMGGIGVYLLISQDHYTCMKMGVGQSTNTRSELLALWTPLYMAKSYGLPSLHIHGLLCNYQLCSTGDHLSPLLH